MPTPKFTRQIEDFVCEHCGFQVKGTGYTNHCPKCLYSKHVDINPGDRMEKCGGLMEPIGMTTKDKAWRLISRCISCGKVKENRLAPADNLELLANIIKNKSN